MLVATGWQHAGYIMLLYLAGLKGSTPLRERRPSTAPASYDEFYWATVLLQSGDEFPVTSALNNLKGQFFVDYNLLSAGSVLVALPPIIVFFVLQQFVAGLTLGATKG